METETKAPQAPDANAPAENVADIELHKLETQHQGGAKWFYWIAALSLVNSAIIHFGGEWSFVVGLGATQFLDVIAAAVAEEVGSGAAIVKALAIAGDLLIAGIFALFGFFALKRKTWAFVAGMALYGVDGLLFLLVGDWLSIGFHVFALLGLAGGLVAARKIESLNEPSRPGTMDYEPIAP